MTMCGELKKKVQLSWAWLGWLENCLQGNSVWRLVAAVLALRFGFRSVRCKFHYFKSSKIEVSKPVS